MRVLKRRSIRTKLIVALTLLSVAVVLLASSGFWGLYRYKQLAKSVSQRAMEIPLANDLHRLAMTMRECNERRFSLQIGQGMIHGQPLVDPLIDFANEEKKLFQQTLTTFSWKLQHYESALEDTPADDSLMVDHTGLQVSLGSVRFTFDELDKFFNKPHHLDGTQSINLNEHLDELVEQTSSHLTLINSGMAKFSSDVRGEYRVWIAVAWSCTILALMTVVTLLCMFRSLVVKPFMTLLAGSRLVVEGNFNHRIDLGTGDELSELAQAMNGMTDRFQGSLAKLDLMNRDLDLMNQDLDRQVQQRTREVIQNEQLASVGFLAAGVAHEINNPLATIAWSAESLVSRVGEQAMIPAEQRRTDDEFCDVLRTNLQRIEDEAYRCKGITEKLLDFSRLSEIRRASTDLVELVSDVVTMVTKVGKYKCKTINIHSGDSVIADVNPQEIRQVVLNLVTNALESVDCDGAVDVSVKQQGANAQIIVKDDGCGMSSEVLEHLFEPFFTRRRDGTGTGLGLSITYRIVCQHGGSLVASSEGENCGSEMVIQLPLQPPQEDQIKVSQEGFLDEPSQAA